MLPAADKLPAAESKQSPRNACGGIFVNATDLSFLRHQLGDVAGQVLAAVVMKEAARLSVGFCPLTTGWPWTAPSVQDKELDPVNWRSVNACPWTEGEPRRPSACPGAGGPMSFPTGSRAAWFVG